MNYTRLFGCMWMVFLMMIIGPYWLYKAFKSPNYKVDLKAWHDELESSMITRPLFNSFINNVLGGHRSKLGWR